MKKILIFLLGVSLMTLSCSKDDDTKIYSDDSAVNEWIKLNKSDFHDVNLEQISSFYGEKQRAVFRFIEPEKRKEIWKEKFEIIKNNCSGNEESTFQEFYDFILRIDFETGLTINDLGYINSVVKKGQEQFNWSDEFIGITFCSFEFVNSTSNYNIFKTADVDEMMMVEDQSSGGEKNNCNCKWGGMFACGSMECVKNNCQDDGKKGCGFLLLESCTGRCQM